MSFAARDELYLAVAHAAAESSAGSAVGVVAQKGLLLLVAVTAALVAWAWARSRRAFWTLATAGVGVVLAYAASELVKLAVQEPRPCLVHDVATILACPSSGDWSWPSNHSVIAAAFATACVLAAPRTGWFVVPLAAAIALSRVAAGVHYPHDVFSGLALGALIVVLTVTALRPLRAKLPAR